MEDSEQDLKRIARHSVTRYLARREYSRYELFQKLSSKGLPVEIVEEVLDQFCEKEIQSDSRFVESYINNAFRRGKGPNYIFSALSQHNISSSEITNVLNQPDFDWFELALQQKIKRFGVDIESDFGLLTKQKRFLSQRGFTSEQIDFACNHRNTE